MASKRMVSKNICISEKINSLTWFQEVLYYRILVNADDLGCFYFEDATIKEICFPRTKLSIKTLHRGKICLLKVGLLDKNVHEGRTYLSVIGWEKYQVLRSDREKHSFFGMSNDAPSGMASGNTEGLGLGLGIGLGRGTSALVENLLKTWVNKNKNQARAYPKNIQRVENEISTAITRGWDPKDIEKKIWETAEQGLAPWQLFPGKNEKPEIDHRKELTEHKLNEISESRKDNAPMPKELKESLKAGFVKGMG